MNIMNFIFRNGIIISVPLFVVSAVLLVICILNLVKLGERSRLFSLPLIEQQTIQFTEAGRVALSLEGPRLSKRFSELSFELASSDGKRILSRTSWFHSRSSGISTVQMGLVSFQVPVQGQYVLRILNIGAAREGDNAHKIILSKPQLFRQVGYILGTIFSAGSLISSIVLLVLRIVSKAGN